MRQILRKSQQKLTELLEKKKETIDSFVVIDTTNYEGDSTQVLANVEENDNEMTMVAGTGQITPQVSVGVSEKPY